MGGKVSTYAIEEFWKARLELLSCILLLKLITMFVQVVEVDVKV